MKVEIDKIQIGERFRKELGDVKSLADSIKKHGLLHPVVIAYTDDIPWLVAGRRRIAACELLERKDIDVTVVSLDAKDFGTAERDENTQRKPFTPTEMFEVTRVLLETEEKAAKERQNTGKKTDEPPYSQKLQGQRTKTAKQQAAEAVGTSESKLRKIEKVIEAAAEKKEYQDIVTEMDETGNVASAARELKKRQRDDRIAEQSHQVRTAEVTLRPDRVYLGNHAFYLLDGAFDLICTDPPYNISQPGRKIEFPEEPRGTPLSNDFGEWDYMSELEYISKTEDWCKDFFRLLRDGGSVYVFCAEAYISILRKSLVEAGFRFKNVLVWARPNPKPKPDKTSFVASCDFILFAVKGEGHTFNYTAHNEMHSLIQMPPASGAEREKWGHTTQKPLALIKRLIEMSSKPGDVVLDPFAGSGTTGEACMELGRTFMLVEQDPESVKIIEARTGIKHEDVGVVDSDGNLLPKTPKMRVY